MNRHWFFSLIGVLVVGTVLILVMWRPWQQRPVPPAVENDPPANAASLTIVKRSGGPCQITIMGEDGNMSNSSSASLAAGDIRSTPICFPAPYTIKTVIVTRGGNPQRRELDLTLAGGRRYELLINPDDTVAVAPAQK